VITVNLRDGVYWIVDGQHRIWAVREFFKDSDPGVVDCRVFDGLDDAQMAHLFLLINQHLKVDSHTKFLVACTAGEPVPTDIRRCVEALGLRIDQRHQKGSIGCTHTLMRLYAYGPDVLEQALVVARDAFGSDASGFDADFLFSLGRVFDRYRVNTGEDEDAASQIRHGDLVRRLAGVPLGVRGVLQRAEQVRLRVGAAKSQCIASAIIDIYNDGCEKGERLAPWWRTK
jgi:hypothetical protein